jgi:hypothetical protein
MFVLNKLIGVLAGEKNQAKQIENEMKQSNESVWTKMTT